VRLLHDSPYLKYTDAWIHVSDNNSDNWTNEWSHDRPTQTSH